MASKDLINSVDVNNPSNTRRSVDLLPNYHRTDKNTKFLASTLDQFIQQPQIERVSSYLGSKLTPNYVPETDQYLPGKTKLRSDYQLEPSLVISEISGAIKTALGYDDLIGQLAFNNASVDNHDRLFHPESYSYDPHIDWDKFINFRQYYWLPTGPDTIEIIGKQKSVESTYTVKDSKDGNSLIFTPDGASTNPLLTLYRGLTYVFNVTSDFPFYIKTAYVEGAQSLASGVTGQGTKIGQVTLTVDEFTPTTLFYFAEGNGTAVGKFAIKSITEDTALDVESDIIGKRNYTSYNGVELSNGMKIRFAGNVVPESYLGKDYFVEGVGSAIHLVDYTKLQAAADKTTNLDVNFDATPFDEYPFDDFEYVPLTPEYITINRASPDQNEWSKYNRWVHGDVITATAKANGIPAVYPIDKQAQRPIIEFKAGLQLYNYGSVAKDNIDLIDESTTDPFSIVENSTGFYIDQVLLEAGFRVVFNAATDPLVKGKIYDVKIAYINNEPRINLEESLDSVPELGNGVIVTKGSKYAGTSWWFDGNVWIYGQQKTALNQFPLFELYDKDANRFADLQYYKASFQGTKVFGYEIGTVYDSVLGFNLSYRNVANVGEYLFDNFFMTDTFTNFENSNIVLLNVADGFLRINKKTGPEYVTVWTKTVDQPIPIIQYQVVQEQTVYIEINAINDPGITSDLKFDVFVNNVKQLRNKDFIFSTDGTKAYIVSTTQFNANDKVLLKIYTSKTPNENGYYEPPINLTNNPLNGPISKFTYTELSDHVKTMLDNHAEFIGVFPGDSNLRNLPDITPYGTRLVTHSNPISFAHYFLSTQEDNIIDAVRKVSADYNQFKTNLMRNISSLKGTYTPGQTLDLAMLAMNRVKETKKNYNYSDMIAYGKNHTTRIYTVTDPRTKVYSLETVFNDRVLSERSVLVYINNSILTKGYDYYVNEYEPSVTIIKTLTKGDVIEIYDYPTTAGSFIPPTPTKLGLYPKFRPQIFEDTTYASGSQMVIQGHDGSITVAYGDYRDDVLLEYEIRVFNNIKVEYNPKLVDLREVLPGAFRKTSYKPEEIDRLISSDFLRWSGYFGVDYHTNNTYDELNSFTFNHTGSIDTLSKNPLKGYWRNVYKYFFDTDRPHTHPWEMLGFSEEPSWWKTKYGPAPYTKGNAVLWSDLEAGLINGTVNPLYVRPGLSKIIPVDEYGNLLSPTDSGLASTPIVNPNDPKRIVMLRSEQVAAQWQIGDQGPAETAWRRSSWWPFAVQILLALCKPAKYAALCFDPSRITVNRSGEYRYGSENIFINLKKVAIFGSGTVENRVLAAGYSVMVVEAGMAKDENYIDMLVDGITNVEYRLMAKLGGFASKDKLQVGIDAVDPTSPYPGVLIPAEDYEIFYNVSQPVQTVGISGLIIQKTNRGWSIRGYDKYSPYFTVYKPFASNIDQTLRVGGNSEAFVTWTENTVYSEGQVVFYNDRYYRVLQKHTTGQIFVGSYYTSLPYLPIVGGVSVLKRTNFDTSAVITVPYGVEYLNIQDVYDFIVGYGKWLEDKGFVFDEYNNDLETILDWTFTAKEFLYWTTQNWAENAVITLSPFANQLTFRSNVGIVDSITNNFYEFSLLKADGNSFPRNSFTVTRLDGQFQISTIDTQEGLFYARLNLIQKEHAIVYKNFTLFNDVIYDVESGYRQRRIKIKGFLTSNWNGDFFSPGFIFDQAEISDWEKYTDYSIGDVVRFSGYYYSAKKTITGTGSFDITQWVQLPEKPTAQLLPNFDYKINQFEDFYSLDIDNFDIGQQRMAQHLIGYTPRPYMNYIISDPIAQYKFYQGMIRDKGTKKSLTSLSKATLNNFRSTIDFNEEWAFRIGYYGGYNTYSEIEIGLESTKFLENPQIIEFVKDKPEFPTDLIYYKNEADLYQAPDNFDINSVFVTTTDSSYVFELPVAGYVRPDDITATAYNKNSVLDIANNKALKKGDTIWLGFREDGDWDVLRVTDVPTFISAIAILIPGQSLTVTTYYPHQLSVGDLVSITGIDSSIDRCYIVQEVLNLNQFVVLSTLTSVPTATNPLSGLIFAFKSSRKKNFDEVSTIPYIDRWAVGEKLWIDEDANGHWAVYKKTNNYSLTTSTQSPVSTIAAFTVTNQFFGTKISTYDGTDTVVVSSPYYSTGTTYGEVFILRKNSFGNLDFYDNYSLNDTYISTYYNPVSGSLDTAFGQSLAYDITNNFVVAGAPKAGRIRSTLTTTGQTFIVNPLGTIGSALNQGAVKISLLSTTTYKLTEHSYVITTTASSTGSNFGWSIALGLPYASTTTFKVSSTNKIAIGTLITSTHISSKSLPVVTSIGNGNLEVNVPQNVNTVSTVLYFNTKEFSITPYANTTTLTVISTANIILDSFVQSVYITATTRVVGIGEGYVRLNVPTTINTSSLVTFVTTSTTGYTLGTQQRVIVGAPKLDNTGTGSVYLFNIDVAQSGSTGSFTVSQAPIVSLTSSTGKTNAYYGFDVTGNRALTRVAVSSPGYSLTTTSGAVYIYDFATTNTIKQIITADILPEQYTMQFNDVFGPYPTNKKYAPGVGRIKMTEDGQYLIIGSPYAYDPSIGLRTGVVDIFKWASTSTLFEHSQRLSIPISAITSGTVFGVDISVNSTNETLVVTSIGEIKSQRPTFDQYTERSTSTQYLYVNDSTSTKRQATTFDGGSTTWSSKIKNAGVAHVYNKLGVGSTKWTYAEALLDSGVRDNSMHGFSVVATSDAILVGAPANPFDGSTGYARGIGQVFEYNKIDPTQNSWNLYRVQEPLVDIKTIQRAITIDTDQEEVKDYIDIIDPLKGRILGTAKAELKYISPYDPGVYSIGTTGVNVNSNSNWLDEHVGELWWDLSNVKYLWYEQGELEYRKNNWNNIFPGSTIDVYEWVGSSYLPSEWAQLADTAEGLTKGISGQPKFNDNSIISVKQVYNSVSNGFTNVYYYWVKNKVIAPTGVKNRKISAYDVARQIADPVSNGSKFIAAVSPTAFIVANAKSLSLNECTSLNISFDSSSQSANRHTEWQLVQENDPNANVNPRLIQKMIDSLLGRDSLGNPVPDPNLTAREKYGIQVRPRQSMFVDRQEALRNVFEYINEICLKEILVGQINFDNLTAQDELPLPGTYDSLVADIYNLELIPTRTLRSAILEAIVSPDGTITGVNVIDSGFGYLVSPTITIDGTGTNADLEAVLDQFGAVTSVTIVNPGRNYSSAVSLTVRPYTAIVESDVNSIGKWAQYEWDDKKGRWIKTRTQDYNVSLYWNYTHWISPEYDPTVDIISTVKSPYALQAIQTIPVGSYVKVQNGGDGRYLILRKTNGSAGTFDLDWDIMVKENGTIQFAEVIWNLSANLYAWDQKIGFDQIEYDQSPSRELDFIAAAVLNDILIGQRSVYLTNLWFKAVRYAMSEQKNIDWAFKTTFINVINNAGRLDQPATYKLQNIQYYENYIEEIKPYHTKVRKFTEQYTSTELSYSFNTDFDLPTYYNTATLNFSKVEFGNDKLLQYPWKSWYDNYAYQVESINVYDGGSGYAQVPAVKIVPAMGDTGSGASAVAFISLGKVTKIIVTNPGSGYTATPSVLISGGGSQNIVSARAYAQLGNSPVRSNSLKIKFDRLTADREVGDQYFTETFPPSDGSTTEFDLKWLPVSDKSLITLTRNGILQLIDSYTIQFTEASYNPQKTLTWQTTYTKKFATLKLNFIPDFGDVISITYPKSLDLYNAASRIEDYYDPQPGMPGKELAQVMSGVEYSGLQVVGLPFTAQGGWEATSISWDQNSWDNLGLEPGYNVYSTTATSTQTFVIPTLITTGTEVNIYVNSTRIDGHALSNTVLNKTLVGLGTGAVDSIEMIVTGSGYNSSYTTWNISAPNTLGGTQAVATATFSGGGISGFTIVNPGSGYTETPVVTIIESINPSNPTSTVTIKAYARAVLRAEFTEYGTTATTSTVTIPSAAFTSSNSLVLFRYSTSDGSVLPTDDSLDAVISGGTVQNGSLVGALGISPSEIILDGGSTSTRHITGMRDDGFLNPINSPAPEECVPGQIQESLGISVYSQPSTTSPIIANKKYYYNGSTRTFKFRVTPSNTDSVIALFNNVKLSKDKYIIDYANNTLTFDSSYNPGNGWLSITTLQLGAVRFLDYINITSTATSNDLTSFVSISDVGSTYVTVNGVSIASSATTYPGTYTLTDIDGAARITVNSSGTIQAFFFEGPVKSVSEITEAFTTSSSNIIPLSSFTPAIGVGNAGPFHSQVIVTVNGRRLRPPVTTYYQVSGGQRLFDISASTQYPLGLIDLNRIEIYVNGTRLPVSRDWRLIQADNQIKFKKNVLQNGDVIAVVVKQDQEYLVQNGNLELTTATTGTISVTTFNNHDPDFIRSEVFRAVPSNRYYMQRSIIDPAYVWVTYSGTSLTVNKDYSVGTDGRTVTLREGIFQSQNDTVVITSFANTEPAIAYRIFRDMLGRTHYKRLSAAGTTRLSQDLHLTDEVISVEDASVLTQPDPASNRPGVVVINGERIEFFVTYNNQLRQIRRATLGTGAKEIYYAGDSVIDQGIGQTIPFQDSKQSTSTFVTTSTATYSLAGWISFDNVSDVFGRPAPQAVDQVEVRYQGIRLLKPATDPANPVITYNHNSNIAYDSTPDLSSTSTTDVQVPYGFTINTSTLEITLNTATVTLVEGAKLEVIKRISSSWYSTTTVTLAQSTTVPAKFLSGVPAILPRFLSSSTYKVVDLDLILETNDILTDENGNPLEGI